MIQIKQKNSSQWSISIQYFAEHCELEGKGGRSLDSLRILPCRILAEGIDHWTKQTRIRTTTTYNSHHSNDASSRLSELESAGKKLLLVETNIMVLETSTNDYSSIATDTPYGCIPNQALPLQALLTPLAMRCKSFL